MYKTASNDWTAFEFFHFQKLPSPTKGSASGDLMYLRALASLETSQAEAQGLRSKLVQPRHRGGRRHPKLGT